MKVSTIFSVIAALAACAMAETSVLPGDSGGPKKDAHSLKELKCKPHGSKKHISWGQLDYNQGTKTPFKNSGNIYTEGEYLKVADPKKDLEPHYQLYECEPPNKEYLPSSDGVVRGILREDSGKCITVYDVHVRVTDCDEYMKKFGAKYQWMEMRQDGMIRYIQKLGYSATEDAREHHGAIDELWGKTREDQKVLYLH